MTDDLPEIKWVRKLDPELDLHWRYLYRLTAEQKANWEKALKEYRTNLQRDVTEADVRMAIDGNTPGSALDRMAWSEADAAFVRAVGPLIATAVERAGKAEVNRLQLDMRFDIENPFVFEWIDNHAAELVVQVSDETKKAIQTVIRQAFEEGIPPRKSAQTIRNLVGLTERDSKAVLRYWKTVAMDGNRPAKVADDMADTYARKLLRRRAETISRHETVAAANKGVLLSYDQAKEQGLMLSTTMKEWIAATDSPRTCARCLGMDAQKVPIGAPFMTDIGPVDGPPLHVQCRCATAAVTAIPI